MPKYQKRKYRAPSCARIMSLLGVEKQCAIKIRRIIRGTLDPASVPSTQAWIDQCYHRPSDLELRMHAIDAILNNHGVEAIDCNYSMACPRAVYSNAGDAYAHTIMYLYEVNQFRLTSWGDYVEKHKDSENFS